MALRRRLPCSRAASTCSSRVRCRRHRRTLSARRSAAGRRAGDTPSIWLATTPRQRRSVAVRRACRSSRMEANDARPWRRACTRHWTTAMRRARAPSTKATGGAGSVSASRSGRRRGALTWLPIAAWTLRVTKRRPSCWRRPCCISMRPCFRAVTRTRLRNLTAPRRSSRVWRARTACAASRWSRSRWWRSRAKGFAASTSTRTRARRPHARASAQALLHRHHRRRHLPMPRRRDTRWAHGGLV